MSGGSLVEPICGIRPRLGTRSCSKILLKEAITVYLEAEGENLTVPEFVALKKIRIT
jgi:hypothetical protein